MQTYQSSDQGNPDITPKLHDTHSSSKLVCVSSEENTVFKNNCFHACNLSTIQIWCTHLRTLFDRMRCRYRAIAVTDPERLQQRQDATDSTPQPAQPAANLQLGLEHRISAVDKQQSLKKQSSVRSDRPHTPKSSSIKAHASPAYSRALLAAQSLAAAFDDACHEIQDHLATGEAGMSTVARHRHNVPGIVFTCMYISIWQHTSYWSCQ
jgi:hypothetical protein